MSLQTMVQLGSVTHTPMSANESTHMHTRRTVGVNQSSD